MKKIWFRCVGLLFFTFAWHISRLLSADPTDLDSLLNLTIKTTTQQTNTASKYMQTTAEAASSITIVTAEEIEIYGYTTLAEALNHVRSFYITEDHMYSYLGSRGFSPLGDYNNRILLLLNGHRMNENVYSSALLGSEFGLDLNSVARIEIIRGPGSSLYGSNALFAVINVITKDVRSFSGLEFQTQIESYGGKKVAVQFGRSLTKNWTLYSTANVADNSGRDLYFKEHDSPATNSGVVQNVDWEKYYGIHASSQYHNFMIQGALTLRRKAYPTATYATLFNDPDAEVSDERAFVSLDYRQNFSVRLSGQFKAYYDWYQYKGFYPEDSDYTYYDESNGRWYGVEAQVVYDLASNNRLLAGFELQNNVRTEYRSWDDTEVFSAVGHPFKVASFFAENEYIPQRYIKFLLGIRLDKFSDTDGRLSPRGAVILMPRKNTSLKFLYGGAFRAANLYESYYEQPNSYAIANPDLQPEVIATNEIVVEQKIGTSLTSTAVLYWYDVNDLIDQVELENPKDPETLMSQYQNVNKMQAKGIELEISGHLTTNLQMYLNYIFQNATNSEDDSPLVNSPRHIAKAGFATPLDKLGSVAFQFRYESGRKTLYDFETDPVWLTDVNLSSPQFLKVFHFHFRIKNLFNYTYAHPAGYDHSPIQVVPQNGRNYSLKITASF